MGKYATLLQSPRTLIVAGKFCNLALSESTLECDILAELWHYNTVYSGITSAVKKTALLRWERNGEMDALSTNTGYIQKICVHLAQ